MTMKISFTQSATGAIKEDVSFFFPQTARCKIMTTGTIGNETNLSPRSISPMAHTEAVVDYQALDMSESTS